MAAGKIQCKVCDFWWDSDDEFGLIPDHKPKGNVLSSKNCPGSKKAPGKTRGFGPKRGPYKK